MVYTMPSLSHGYAGIEKFNTLMNIPKPMTVKNYNKTVFVEQKQLLKLLLKRDNGWCKQWNTWQCSINRWYF